MRYMCRAQLLSLLLLPLLKARLSVPAHPIPQSFLPLLISTWNYTDANREAWTVLRQGPRRTRQAVIQGCLHCQNSNSCGRLLGGHSAPDSSGGITLEAALIDGANMDYGAVAGMPGIRNAIGVAHDVLRYTNHSLLVGEAAASFAEAMGHKKEVHSLSTTLDVLLPWLLGKCQPNFWRNVRPLANDSCGTFSPLPQEQHQREMRQEYPIEPGHHDQVGFLALDTEGHLHAASLSSGARFRIPGRVGDAAVPGAGIYADNQVGGALATGDGDVLMRFLPALLAVEALRAGQSPASAAEAVMRRLLRHHTEFNGGLVVVSRGGVYSAACAGLDEFQFVVSGESRGRSMRRVERIKCLDRHEVVTGGPRGDFYVAPKKIWAAGGEDVLVQRVEKITLNEGVDSREFEEEYVEDKAAEIDEDEGEKAEEVRSLLDESPGDLLLHQLGLAPPFPFRFPFIYF
ncbi:L-asparaginase-like protein GA18140 [Drosophila miranda]|uniref:L-asparaginase-like protein GA18140 n=1 Tax=Drosophila miranda TaxID=7229 RepID=UPI0007E76C02|nr:L-asparaginase-like protein GA18140 [Drosophila miranda]